MVLDTRMFHVAQAVVHTAIQHTVAWILGRSKSTYPSGLSRRGGKSVYHGRPVRPVQLSWASSRSSSSGKPMHSKTLPNLTPAVCGPTYRAHPPCLWVLRRSVVPKLQAR